MKQLELNFGILPTPEDMWVHECPGVGTLATENGYPCNWCNAEGVTKDEQKKSTN